MTTMTTTTLTTRTRRHARILLAAPLLALALLLPLSGGAGAQDANGDGIEDLYTPLLGTAGPSLDVSGLVGIVTTDSDNDGITDWDEVNYYYTDPNDYDTDGDGSDDWSEAVNGRGDPLGAYEDTDTDGIEDWAELTHFGTDPNNGDSDGDGAGDGSEVREGTDPLDPTSRYMDIIK